MATAFILTNTEVGGEEEVMEGLRKIENVEEVYIVYGIYDIIAKAEAETGKARRACNFKNT